MMKLARTKFAAELGSPKAARQIPKLAFLAISDAGVSYLHLLKTFMMAGVTRSVEDSRKEGQKRYMTYWKRKLN